MLKATFTESFILVSQFEKCGDFLLLIRQTIGKNIMVNQLRLFCKELISRESNSAVLSLRENTYCLRFTLMFLRNCWNKFFTCWVVELLVVWGDEETIEVLEAAGSWVWEFQFCTHKLFRLFFQTVWNGTLTLDGNKYIDLARPKSGASIFWLVLNIDTQYGQQSFSFGDYVTPLSPMLLFCGLYLLSESLEQNLTCFCTTNVANLLQMFGKYL